MRVTAGAEVRLTAGAHPCGRRCTSGWRDDARGRRARRELFDGLREFGREMRGSVESAMETALGELEVELDMRPSRRGEGMGGGAELRA